MNSKTRILIVDDDPVEIKLLSSILIENQYNVTASSEADRGLQMAMDQCPDVLILDVMMPVINGFNFCQLLKNEEKQKDIKVIMVTGRDELEDINIGMQMGADAYLTKPINREELLRTIKIVQSGHKTH
ncbi:MAG: response regulator [Candidatus Omnitrophica bacterium]|nr:response regulator [Candidatus Omnitrophota bacterium]